VHLLAAVSMPPSISSVPVIPIASGSTLEWVTGVGTAAGALAAAFAAWVALYVGMIQVRRRRPKLTMHFPVLGRELVDVGNMTTGESAWIRLLITNSPGHETAEDVEVLIEDLREIAPRKGAVPWTSAPALAGTALRWSMKEEGASDEDRAHIATGGQRLLDLASVHRRRNPFKSIRPLELLTAWRPSDHRQHLLSAEVELDLVVTARNTNASRYLVRISFDGTWGSDIWQHLRVTKLSQR
jgi:hypothetical protein